MNKVKGLVAAGLLALSLGGCKAEYLEGTVIKESGTVLNLVESSGAIPLFGNESVKFGEPSYILTVETSEGNYIVDVSPHFYYFKKTLPALSEAIEVGSKIRFRTNDSNGRSFFRKDKIGRIYCDFVEVLER